MRIAELERILKRLKMSQNRFSQEIGVSQSTVCKWIGGYHRISKAMAKHIRRTADELMEKGTAA